jgi:hypothetical protein
MFSLQKNELQGGKKMNKINIDKDAMKADHPEYFKQESAYEVKKAETINPAISQLPVATEWKTYGVSNDNLEHVEVPFKTTIMVNRQPVAVMSKRYKLVQHAEAFRPIIEGLTLKGVTDFQYTMWHTDKLANLAVYLGEGVDGVKMGFRCINSFDGSYAITFGMSAYQKQDEVKIVEKEQVMVWGFRQVCSNGMVIKVPLKTCKYLDAVTVTTIKELMTQHQRIIHMGNVAGKLEAVQYTVEAFYLLKEPINRMIIDAQNSKLTKEVARAFIEKYVSKRFAARYMEQYGLEDQTLWGLYNAVTYVASHTKTFSNSKRELVLAKAADLLEKELVVAN